MPYETPKGVAFKRVIRVDAILNGELCPEHPIQVRRETEAEGGRLVFYWPNLVSSDYGGEDFTMAFPIFKGGVSVQAISRDGLDEFIDPEDHVATVTPARGYQGPTLDRFGRVRLDGEAAVVARSLMHVAENDPENVVPDALQDFIEDQLQKHLHWLPEAGRSFSDEGELDDVEHEDTPYFYWRGKWDEFFIAYLDTEVGDDVHGDPQILLYRVHHDDYCPITDYEAYDLVSSQLDDVWAAAALIEYHYSHENGWTRTYTGK